jgi:hypothetical protein
VATRSRPATPSRAFSAEELGEAALTAFFNIAHRWQLTSEEERTLLGNPPRSTFYKWKKAKRAQLAADTLERISYILGIYKALHLLLPTSRSADAWIRQANTASLFHGHSALQKMLAGRVVDLADVRRYLDAERG